MFRSSTVHIAEHNKHPARPAQSETAIPHDIVPQTTTSSRSRIHSDLMACPANRSAATGVLRSHPSQPPVREYLYVPSSPCHLATFVESDVVLRP